MCLPLRGRLKKGTFAKSHVGLLMEEEAEEAGMKSGALPVLHYAPQAKNARQTVIKMTGMTTL